MSFGARRWQGQPRPLPSVVCFHHQSKALVCSLSCARHCSSRAGLFYLSIRQICVLKLFFLSSMSTSGESATSTSFSTMASGSSTLGTATSTTATTSTIALTPSPSPAPTPAPTPAPSPQPGSECTAYLQCSQCVTATYQSSQCVWCVVSVDSLSGSCATQCDAGETNVAGTCPTPAPTPCESFFVLGCGVHTSYCRFVLYFCFYSFTHIVVIYM